jgi:hypothetical protein
MQTSLKGVDGVSISQTPLAKANASPFELGFIFQFPAMNGLLLACASSFVDASAYPSRVGWRKPAMLGGTIRKDNSNEGRDSDSSSSRERRKKIGDRDDLLPGLILSRVGRETTQRAIGSESKNTL